MQIVHSQLILLSEDVMYQELDVREISLFGLMVCRLIEVKELSDHGTVADMFGYGAETVILGNAADIVLTVVLAQGLVVPCDALLYIPSVQFRLFHNLVERCADTDKLFLRHAVIHWRSVAVF